MTGRAIITVDGADDRNRAHHWINRAPKGTRVEFKGPQRTPEQNDRMWAMLTDIVTQHAFNGRRYTTDEAKVVFMHACGKDVRILPITGRENLCSLRAIVLRSNRPGNVGPDRIHVRVGR